MIEEYKDLKKFNTFMVPTTAKYFVRIKEGEEIKKIVLSKEWKSSKKYLVLGGGSNILFVSDYNGFVLKNEIIGIDIIEENDEYIIVRVGAGENWHNFVMWSVERGLWGIENLVYIPGTVGAAPVQNIGAYGVEVKSSIYSIEYIDLKDSKLNIINGKDCEFGYRNSFFKKKNGRHFITHVIFKLYKKGQAILDYGELAEVIKEKNIKVPNPNDIANIIIEIRKSKLPEINEVGNAGSFFKNPIIYREALEKIKIKFPDIKYFELDNGGIKISAGWILDELGYKDFAGGHVGNYKKHALIIVHDGDGTGEEIYEYIQSIKKDVRDIFGIELEPEVNIIK